MDSFARHVAVLLFAVLAAGCAGSSASSHRASSQDAGALLVDASLIGAPAEPPAIVAAPEAAPAQPVPTEAKPPAAEEEAAMTTTVTTTVTTTTVTTTTEEILPPRALPAPATPAAPAPAAAKPPAAVTATAARPLLDVASLKARLRETSAIGTLAKLSLRSQMDELVRQLRAHHLSGLAGGIASMRAPYDALVFRVLTAVREGDPSLARLIGDSREALWQLLADPLRFDSITRRKSPLEHAQIRRRAAQERHLVGGAAHYRHAKTANG